MTARNRATNADRPAQPCRPVESAGRTADRRCGGSASGDRAGSHGGQRGRLADVLGVHVNDAVQDVHRGAGAVGHCDHGSGWHPMRHTSHPQVLGGRRAATGCALTRSCSPAGAGPGGGGYGFGLVIGPVTTCAWLTAGEGDSRRGCSPWRPGVACHSPK
jgi:hypothetical protein